MTKSLPPKSLVLYADDDPDDQEFVQEAFSAYQNTIDLILFNNGAELLSYIGNDFPYTLPCLVILDINMPYLNGKETLKKIREKKDWENVAVVLFSTSTLPADNEFAKRYGAYFITKPLHAIQIHQLMDQFIEHCSDEVKRKIRSQGSGQ